METSTLEQVIADRAPEAVDAIYQAMERLSEDKCTVTEAYAAVLETIVVDILRVGMKD